ncbi:MAG: dihydroorotase [candidate division Zixibacteria bacterium]|nr:dihydroorotase [candidate division Zixibacteria bacterium]
MISGGTIVDPVDGYFGPGAVKVVNGKIAEVIKSKNSPKGDIDATGLLVCPGLVDMHVHFREPGFEYKETIESGARAAAAGGFTSVACMPNTDPPLDNQEAIKFVIDKARKAVVNVYPIGTLTKGQKGQELAEIGDMIDAGAVAFSDDGAGIQNGTIMRRAMEYCKMLDVIPISHCEYADLADNGVINEGYASTKLGLGGISRVAEDLMIAREIMLAEYTGAPVHLAHVSTAGGVELIKNAKKKKLPVTAETCPHYFTLHDELLKGYSTNMKVNPPLRTRKDRTAIRRGIAAGLFDCIVTDHAPHAYDEKQLEFDYAPPGMIGLETSVGLVSTELIAKNRITWLDAIKMMSLNQARILNIPAGTLDTGAAADITLIDPKIQWTVTEDAFHSLSKNSPYIGKELTGRVARTIVAGKTVYELG